MVSRLLFAAAVVVAASCANDPVTRAPTPGGAMALPAIAGGWTSDRSDPLGRPLTAAPTPRLLLRQPVGVVASGNDVYIVDIGLRQLLRYDVARDTLTPIVPFTTLTPDQIGMAIGPDLSLYVADPGARRVLRLARDGRVVQTFADEVHLVRPGGLAVDRAGNLIVADRSLRHLVYFNALGGILRVVDELGGERIGAVGGLTSTQPPWLLDAQARRAVPVAQGDTGAAGAPIALATVRIPGAIAADQDGTLYVVDRADNSVRVFQRGTEVARIESAGAGRFADPFALAVDSGRLYVADRVAARVHVLVIPPQWTPASSGAAGR